MGQVVLLVVAAAWAAVLLPPLLRSRLENRPNSSVLDFRNQLSSLQRVVPTRGGVWSMGRSLAPSNLARPAAPGRPGTRNGARINGVVSSRMDPAVTARPTRRDARRDDTVARPRQHGDTADLRRPSPVASRSAEVKRRRANVLFLLVLTTLCAGFLAATTDSKGMVYLFAVSLVALGGYVYLLVTLNQQRPQPIGGYGDPRADASPRRASTGHAVADSGLRRRRAVGDAYRYDGDDDTFWEAERRPRRTTSASRQRVAAPVAADPHAGHAAAAMPGSGQSGRISYGSGAARRDPRDPYGREAYGWEAETRAVTRRAPVRNGRHATGQVPVQRERYRQPVADEYYSNAG